MNPVRITVQWDSARLHKNKRLNPFERRELGRQARVAALAGYREAGSPRLEGAVRVQLILRQARRLDPDSAMSGLPHLVDALFCRQKSDTAEGVTEDDSSDFLTWLPVQQEIDPQWRGREQVIFEITPQEGEAMAALPRNKFQATGCVVGEIAAVALCAPSLRHTISVRETYRLVRELLQAVEDAERMLATLPPEIAP